MIDIDPAPIPDSWPISFSTMWQGLQCARQVAYDRSGQLRALLVAPNLQGALGRAAHGTLRTAAGRTLAQGTLDEVWQEQLIHEGNRLITTSVGAPPPPTSWPNYWVTYERLRARLVRTEETESTYAARRSPKQPTIDARYELPFYEKTFHDIEGGIVGTPDLVYRNPDGDVTIRDYKTGSTSSPERESAQLHLYAHLVERATGFAVRTGEIDRLRGEPERVPITNPEVARLRMLATHVRREVLRPDVSGAQDANTCIRCPYRMICSRALPNAENAALGDLFGVITEVVTTDDDRISALILEVDQDMIALGGLESRSLQLEVGDSIVVLGARGRASTGGLLAEWSTVVNSSQRLTEAASQASA